MTRLGLNIGGRRKTHAVAVAVILACGACGAGRLPAPTYIGQPTDALELVPYPPPPARAEFVPAQPNDDAAVWIDGEWIWQGTRWAWKPGHWVVPPANASYSPWTAVRGQTGNLYVAAGRWRNAKGGEVADPKALAVARTRAGGVVNPEGEAVPASPNVRAGAKSGRADAGADDGGAPETPAGATPTGTEPKSGPARDAGSPDAVAP